MFSSSIRILSFNKLCLRSLGGGHGVPDLEAEGAAHGRRHGVTDLAVLLQRGPVELVGVGEALAPGALPHTHQPGHRHRT